MTKLLKLKSRIVLKHGSQFHFALKMGFHESIVSMVVCGKRVLSPKEQKRWAKGLGVSVNDIFPK